MEMNEERAIETDYFVIKGIMFSRLDLLAIAWWMENKKEDSK